MGGFGRWVRWLIPLLIIAFGVLWPVLFNGGSGGDAGSDPVTIADYRAEFRVDADGNLEATEWITGVFPGNRHGIFRYWDVANPNNPACGSTRASTRS